ncbi:DUF190 domain-containing protein [Phytoactinopolyspora alkaliphila]|uniref:DUF190 domain-containing protein n=1 Tax=Phytoactinopolyspora alkaliphila TaxID=1783498 RepID=A0A6N9YNQ8_9ACTN|nr:DUF190 domain-containing protein [Phytoactinopolyspora alkaliphila]NED96633.1 DUF190 domain-containing protein [Phytoactinopolyspora alkaliphila]
MTLRGPARSGSSHIHSTRIFNLSEDLPLATVIAGLPEKIDELVAGVESPVEEGLSTGDDVEVVRCIGRGTGGGPTADNR